MTFLCLSSLKKRKGGDSDGHAKRMSIVPEDEDEDGGIQIKASSNNKNA